MSRNAGFVKLWSLLARLREKGWKPQTLHTYSSAYRRQFKAAGRTWKMSLNPSVFGRASMLNLWFSPSPFPKQDEWEKLDQLPFAKALDRKANHLRYLKVFGTSSGGSILFYKRITSFNHIAAALKTLSALDFNALENQRIPSSRALRGPIKPVREAVRMKLMAKLADRCLRRNRDGFRPSHLQISMYTHEKGGGHSWSVSRALLWNLNPKSVHIPSRFCAMLMIWPRSLSKRGRRDLEKSGFYERIQRSLKKLGFPGKWVNHRDKFGDFGRYQLRWMDIAPTAKIMTEWTVRSALQE